MWRRDWRRVLGLLLFLCVFCYPLQPQELSFKHIDWEAVEGNLTSIEYNLKLLETNNKFLQQQLSNANSQTTNSVGQLREQIREIRESYETMERCLRNYYNCRNYSSSNNAEVD